MGGRHTKARATRHPEGTSSQTSILWGGRLKHQNENAHKNPMEGPPLVQPASQAQGQVLPPSRSLIGIEIVFWLRNSRWWTWSSTFPLPKRLLHQTPSKRWKGQILAAPHHPAPKHQAKHLPEEVHQKHQNEDEKEKTPPQKRDKSTKPLYLSGFFHLAAGFCRCNKESNDPSSILHLFNLLTWARCFQLLEKHLRQESDRSRKVYKKRVYPYIYIINIYIHTIYGWCIMYAYYRHIICRVCLHVIMAGISTPHLIGL